MVSGLHPAMKPMHRTLSLRRGKEHMRDRQTANVSYITSSTKSINAKTNGDGP